MAEEPARKAEGDAERAALSEATGPAGVYAIAAGLSLTSVATLLSIVMSMATTKVIALYGGPESVALMGLFRNLGVLVTNVLSVGFGVLVMQKLSNAATRDEHSRIIGAGGLLLAAQLAVVLLAAVWLARPFGAWIFAAAPSAGQVLQVRIVLAMAFINLALQLVTGMLKGQANLRVIAAVPLATSAVSLALAYPLVQMGPIGLAINVGSGSAIGAMVGALLVFAIYRPELRVSSAGRYWAFLRTMMRPSTYMVVVSAVVAAGLLAAQTTVQSYHGVEQLGRYNAVMMIYDTAVMLLMASGRTYLVPMLGQMRDEAAKARLIGRVVIALVVASVTFAAGSALLGGQVLSVLFSSEFVAGAGLLTAQSVSLVGISFTYSLNAYLLHKEDVGTLVAIDVVWMAMIVGGTWFTASMGYGPESAAWSYAAASWIAGGMYVVAARLRHGLPLGRAMRA